MFARYRRRKADSRLLLVGDYRGTSVHTRLRERVPFLGLSLVDDVVFTGTWSRRPPGLLRGFGRFLCLSEHEGFCVPCRGHGSSLPGWPTTRARSGRRCAARACCSRGRTRRSGGSVWAAARGRHAAPVGAVDTHGARWGSSAHGLRGLCSRCSLPALTRREDRPVGARAAPRGRDRRQRAAQCGMPSGAGATRPTSTRCSSTRTSGATAGTGRSGVRAGRGRRWSPSLRASLAAHRGLARAPRRARAAAPNITPPEFFLTATPEMVRICALGREEWKAAARGGGPGPGRQRVQPPRAGEAGSAHRRVAILLDFERYRETPAPRSRPGCGRPHQPGFVAA